jgi:DNA-binding response OmpR family regulator
LPAFFDDMQAAIKSFAESLLEATRPSCSKESARLVAAGQLLDGPAEASTPHLTLFVLGNWDLTEPGRGVYKGTPFPLEGVCRKLLARLIRGRGRTVRAADLMEACGNPQMERSTLTGYISRLRKHLSQHLGPHVGPGGPASPITYADPEGYLLHLS